jgi:LysR family glycine cleavage system transcriptional activator
MNNIESLPRMPPLPALRAFESAARHGSFSMAAMELSLTHGAIGHQVRALEENMGVQLFDRIGRGLLLTSDGRAFAEQVRKALLDIAAATSQVRRKVDNNKLTLSALPSFATRWLVPRIGRFIAKNPDLELLIQTTIAVVDFKREPVDLCIRFGVGPWEGLWSERFLDDTYYPVCAPSFQQNNGSIENPAQLRHLPLLSCSHEPWMPWFRAAALKNMAEPRGVTYSDAVNLLDAAKEGQGIALARHSLVKEDILSGQLQRLFSVSVSSQMSYHLVSAHSTAETCKVKRFRAWLWSELKKTG